jgi:hypothetical protein
VVTSMLRPLCSRERTPVFIEYEAGWAPRASLDISERRQISHTHFCKEESFEDCKEYEERARFWCIHFVCVYVYLTILQINTEKERVLKYTSVKITDLKYFALTQLEHRKICAEFYAAFVH